MKVISFFIAVILLAALMVFFSPERTFMIPGVSQNVADKSSQKEISFLGWIPYWDQPRATKSFKDQVSLFDYVSFFWYHLDQEGRIIPYRETKEDKTLIEFAHDNEVKTLAVVSNLPDYEEGGTWDPIRVRKAIALEKSRDEHIQELLSLVTQGGFDGINIDYEAMKRSDREIFSLFVEELSDTFHQAGKIVGVALHPKTSENNPEEANGSEAQDWERISGVADQMYLMTYSEHYKGSVPGPNASPQWVRKILSYAIDEVHVPLEKLFMGIPFYGHLWKEISGGKFYGEDDDVTFEDATLLQKRFRTSIVWDEQSETPYLSYTKDGENHITWFEDAKSVTVKISLGKTLGVSNVAFWRLGGEDPRIWEVLQK